MRTLFKEIIMLYLSFNIAVCANERLVVDSTSRITETLMNEPISNLIPIVDFPDTINWRIKSINWKNIFGNKVVHINKKKINEFRNKSITQVVTFFERDSIYIVGHFGINEKLFRIDIISNKNIKPLAQSGYHFQMKTFLNEKKYFGYKFFKGVKKELKCISYSLIRFYEK